MQGEFLLVFGILALFVCSALLLEQFYMQSILGMLVTIAASFFFLSLFSLAAHFSLRLEKQLVVSGFKKKISKTR